MDVWVGGMATDVYTDFYFFGHFWTFYLPDLESGENVILQMCANYYDHCMCLWVVMVADGQTSIILVIFCPLPLHHHPLKDRKIPKICKILLSPNAILDGGGNI